MERRMNDDEIVLRSSISMSGMRNLHIVRVGAEVDQGYWLEQVPGQCRGLEQKFSWREGEITVRHHLMIWWPCRYELVKGAERGVMVVTRLINGDRVGEVVINAAMTLWAGVDRWPAQAVMREWPANMPESLELGGSEIRLVAAGWALNRCVIVL
jgi:hypothetical protein